ncbi:MAG: phage antirepressor N-terminal domain-containing protein [Bacteroidales bacterium]|jgi:hypothetical protein|nr:phage antirepressor N-terminal domain-containing protein [Bacteroidales bacterium]
MKLTHIKILNKEIELLYENNNVYVPIKPICEIIGVSNQKQQEKLKDDENFASIITLRVTVGGDEKQREMLCLPIMYIPAWLFTITPANVKEDAKDKLIKYRAQCIEALGNHFITSVIDLRESLDAIENAESELKELDKEFKESNIYKRKTELKDIISSNKERIEKIGDGYQLKLF